VYVKFQENSSYNPNGKQYIISDRSYSIFLKNPVANRITIANMTVFGSKTQFYLENASNTYLTGLNISGGIYGVDVNDAGSDVSSNIHITNNSFFNYMLNDPNVVWNDYYTGSANNYQPTGVRLQDSAYRQDIFIADNEFSGWFDSARIGSQLGRADNMAFIRNFVHSNMDDGIEVEGLYNLNYNISNNLFMDCFVSLSVAPTNSSLGTTYLYNNLLITNGSVYSDHVGGLWFGRCIKEDGGTTVNAGIVNLTFLNNLCWMDDGTYGVDELQSFKTKLVNLSYYNNILYSTGYQELMSGGGNTTDNTKRDYNLYKSLSSQYFTRWNNFSDTTTYTSLATAKASGKDKGQWDNHSIDASPAWDTSYTGNFTRFTPNASSPLIDAGAGLFVQEQEPDVFGNPAYLPRDIGPVEYQPPYNSTSTNVPYNLKSRIYADGKYRYMTFGTVVNSNLSIRNWTAYSDLSARPKVMDIQFLNSTLNETKFALNVSQSMPLNYTITGLNPSSVFRIYRNATYLSNFTSNSTGGGTFSQTEIVGYYIITLGINSTGTSPEDTCSCPGAGNPWLIDFSDNCVISTACSVSDFGIASTSTGTWLINSTITVSGTLYLNMSNGQYLNMTNCNAGYIKKV
jgi:hypothetical protein